MILFMRPENVSRTQPMAVHYYSHVSPSVSRDQYTALPLEGVLVT